MGLVNAFLNSDITHWEATGIDVHNQPTFAEPRTIKARWEDRSEYIIDKDGNSVLSRSRIYLEDDIVVGDYLFNGISTASDPRNVDGAFRVLDSRKLPDLFNNEYERRVFL